MVITIEMPKLSDTMSEGKILAWKKSEGDAVKSGEVLVEIESDKSNMEYEAADAGFLRKILVSDGASAPIGAPIALMTETADEDFSSAMPSGSGAQAAPAAKPHGPAATAAPAPKPAPAKEAPTSPAPAPRKSTATSVRTAEPPANGGQPRPAAARGSRILASPLAARMAGELGLNLGDVRGTGPDGRIVKRDILEASQKKGTKAPAAGAAGPARPKPSGAPFRPAPVGPLPAQQQEDHPVSGMRRIIGARLVESVTTSPHFYVTMEVDMKRASEARERLNSIDGVAVTFNDFVVKASALALLRNKSLNASWQGEFIRQYESIDIGVAVAIPDGLITPVVRACHLKSLGQISQEIKELAERAKQKKLSPDDYKGGTFTISNLGMFGVKHFTAIINPPEACILAVGGVEDVPVVENGAIVPGRRMCLTLSSDHRVVDGAAAARFLRDLKGFLEDPVSLAL